MNDKIERIRTLLIAKIKSCVSDGVLTHESHEEMAQIIGCNPDDVKIWGLNIDDYQAGQAVIMTAAGRFVIDANPGETAFYETFKGRDVQLSSETEAIIFESDHESAINAAFGSDSNEIIKLCQSLGVEIKRDIKITPYRTSMTFNKNDLLAV